MIPGIYKAYQYHMVDYLMAENPYIEATFAELYAALRAKAFATGMTDASELSDFMRY